MAPKTKQKPRDEGGNAMICVLIVIVLFGALAFVLSRQRAGANETGQLTTQTVNTDATQIINTSNQIKQAVDEMVYGGTRVDQLDFCLPADSCFAGGDAKSQVFNASGGGLIPPSLPDSAVAQVDANPAPGWYLGAFNNVEWTPTAANDVVVTAHQIGKPVCARINELINGSAAIPAVSQPLAKVLVDAARHSQGNVAFDKTICPDCDGKPTLCVSNADGSMFSFYNVIEPR